MTATNFLELALLDHALATSAYSIPAGTFVKLHLGDPGEDGTANPAAETTRKAVTFAAAAAGSATTTGTPAASWTSVAATETFTHFSIWDAVTAGNPLFTGALSASVAMNAGEDFDLDSVTVTAD